MGLCFFPLHINPVKRFGNFKPVNPFKKLAGQTAIYGLSSMVGRAVNFLLVPFYTAQQVLSTEEFGIMSEFYAYVAFFNIIYQFGMETTYFRYANKGDEPKTFNNVVSFLLVISLLLSGGLFAFATPIINYLGYSGKENYIYFLAAVLFIDSVVAVPFARLRFENQAVKFASVRLGNIFLNIFFNVLFLVVFKQIYLGNWFSGLSASIHFIYNPTFGVGYVFLANLLANVFFIPMLISSFKGFRFSFDGSYMKELILYAYPIIFMGIAQMINEVIDRRMLLSLLPEGIHGNYSKLESVGIYSACYKFSMFMSLATQSFRYAAEPFFFSKADKKDAPETYALVLKWFIVATSVIYVAVSVYRFLIADIILRSEVYHTGLVIVPFLLLANLFLGVYYNQSIWYKVTDKTYWGTVITIIGAVITLVLNFILIPIYGYVGSAIATLVCYAFISILSYIIGHKYYPVPYKIGSALFYLSLSTILVGVSMFLYSENTLISFAEASGLFITYLVIIYLVEKKNLTNKKRDF